MNEDALLKKLREVYTALDVDTSGFGLPDMTYAFGSPLDALMYSGLFWPAFVEIDGMVFLKGTIEDDEDRQRLKEAFEQHNGDVARTEEDFNLVEIPSDLFGRRAAELLRKRMVGLQSVWQKCGMLASACFTQAVSL